MALFSFQTAFVDSINWLTASLDDKNILIFYFFSRGMAIFKLKTSYLPFVSCVWVSPTSIIAAGHDCTPLVFQINTSGQVLDAIFFYQIAWLIKFFV